jgi:hypothetical protein
MLMIITVFPVVSSSFQTAEIKNQTINQPVHTPPLPAYAPTLPPYRDNDVNQVSFYPEIPANSMSEVIISMIQQVDESTFLKYEENLTANGPRKTGSTACVAAAEYMYNEFQDMGLAVRYQHWNSYGYSSDNVEATINGTDEASNDIYIICAHYDTVSAGVGADDDTSGTAAVLIAASILSQYQFNHTVKFVAFSGEEEGLLGSAAYAHEAKTQGWDIIGVLNCDMISYAITSVDGSNLIVYVNSASEWLYSYTVGISNEYADYIQLTLIHGGAPPGGSDHESFWYEGYDAIFYFEYTETPYYHTAQDTMDHINATYAVKNIKLGLATLAGLSEGSYKSNAPDKPTLTGPTLGVLNKNYEYTVVATEPDGEDVYYFIDWGDGTNTGWFGPYSPGTSTVSQKAWNAPANYTVKARAKDIHDVASVWSDSLIVSIIDDNPPNTPTISGEKKGKVNTPYPYTFKSTDVNGDQVYFTIDWGDGQIDEWVGPYNSEEQAEFTHQWDTKGDYTIKAKAKDIHGIESDWGSLSVTMPKSYNIQFQSFLERLFERFPNIFPILRHLLGY